MRNTSQIELHIEDVAAGAALAAISLGIGDTTFGRLRVGEYFKFAADTKANRKTSSNSYTTSAGHAFKTSTLSAVFKVQP